MTVRNDSIGIPYLLTYKQAGGRGIVGYSFG